MGLELELKAPAHLGRVEARLKELGASLIDVVDEVDVYLQHPCRDFTSTDEALRLRRQGGLTTLTYKGPRLSSTGQVKARDEVEVSVSSFEAALEVLERLGFRKVAEVVKRRRVYELNGFKVYLDSVEGLGSFVEVECRSSPEELEKARSSIFKLAKQLGIEVEKALDASYLEMYLERVGRAPRGLREAA